MCGIVGIPKERYNIEYVFFDCAKPKVYVFLNHRVAYLCWIDALKKRIIRNGALLFHIDHHADFSLSSRDLLEEQKRISIDQEKELEEFVRNKLSVLNYEFIVLSMFRGIMGDVISVDVVHDNIYGEYEEMTYKTTKRRVFTDDSGNPHTFYLGGSSITELVGYQGLLTDSWTHQDVQKVFNENVKRNNMVLDIDLDYFTYRNNEARTWAMNERNLKRVLHSEGFRYVFDRATLVTIALEPYFCGDKVEFQHILDGLDSFLDETIELKVKKEIFRKFKKELLEPQ